MISTNEVSGIAGDLIAMEERPDSTPLLKDFDFPTLVVVGDHDLATPPDEVKSMAGHIPGSRFEVIPQAGHMSNMENPKVFNAKLLEFLNELPKRD